MVVPSDYNGGNFRPEKPIARYEIALMVTRALGQVIEANLEEGLNLSFTDNEDILDWMKGYVHMASEAGVVRGYPDAASSPTRRLPGQRRWSWSSGCWMKWSRLLSPRGSGQDENIRRRTGRI